MDRLRRSFRRISSKRSRLNKDRSSSFKLENDRNDQNSTKDVHEIMKVPTTSNANNTPIKSPDKQTNKGERSSQRSSQNDHDNNSSSPSDTTGTPDKTDHVVPSLIRFQDDLQPIDTNKSIIHQNDEKMVRQGTANFKVRFIGFIEVKDPRGMEVCEAAVKELKVLKSNKGKNGDNRKEIETDINIKAKQKAKSSSSKKNSKPTDNKKTDEPEERKPEKENETTPDIPNSTSEVQLQVQQELTKLRNDISQVTKLAENNLLPEENIPKKTLWQRMSMRKKRGQRSSSQKRDSLISGNRSRGNTDISNGTNATSKEEDSGLKIALNSDVSSTKSGRKYKIVDQKAVLWISPDSLRVVDKHKNLLLGWGFH